jgi:hypothetical protein
MNRNIAFHGLMNGDMGVIWHATSDELREACQAFRDIEQHSEDADIRRKARKARALTEPRIAELDRINVEG